MEKILNIYISINDLPFYEKYPLIVKNTPIKYNNFNVYYNYIDILGDFDALKSNIETTVKTALEFATKFSKEPLQPKPDSIEKIVASIEQVYNKFYNSSIEQRSIFDIFTEIFFKIIKFHYLVNGNKRMAFACLDRFMLISGFSIKDGLSYIDIDKEIVNFASSNLKDDKLKLKIKDFIINNAIIKYNKKLGEQIWKIKKLNL